MKDNIFPEGEKVSVALAALPFVVENIPTWSENEARGKDWAAAGSDNQYFNWLYSLYEDSATLQSLINGITDYVLGNEVVMNFNLGWGPGIVNRKGETITELLGKLQADRLIFGGYYIQVVRDALNKPKELYYLDYRQVRTNEHNDVFWFSTDFTDNKTYGRCKTITYPKFIPGTEFQQPASVFMYKGPQSRGIYPRPCYSGALKPILTDIKINEFGLNEVSNNFTASALINLNNGIPDNETKAKVEKDIHEKFCGSENAGRFVLSFNQDKDHEVSITRLGADDFDDRYNALQDRVQSQIYVAFRATPNLFGLPTKTTGFNSQEYQDAYSLFYKSVIRPYQAALVDSIDKIIGMKGSISITPFSLDLDQNNTSNVQ